MLPCGRTLTFYMSLSEKTVVIVNYRCMLRSGRDCHMCQKWRHLIREPELTNPTTFIRTQWIDQTNRVICIGGRGRRYCNCIRYHGWIFNTYVYKWHTGMGKFDPQQVNYCRVEARQLMVQCGGWIWDSVWQCLWNHYVCRPFWSWKPLLIHYVCPCRNVHFCRYQISLKYQYCNTIHFFSFT